MFLFVFVHPMCKIAKCENLHSSMSLFVNSQEEEIKLKPVIAFDFGMNFPLDVISMDINLSCQFLVWAVLNAWTLDIMLAQYIFWHYAFARAWEGQETSIPQVIWRSKVLCKRTKSHFRKWHGGYWFAKTSRCSCLLTSLPMPGLATCQPCALHDEFVC